MLDFRLKSLEIYHSMPNPTWGPSIAGLDMDHIVTYVKPNTEQKADWDSVPDDIKNTFERLGIPEAERSYLAGVGAQYDSELVYHNMQETAANMGIVYSGIEEALHEPRWEELIHEKFMTLIPPTDHKFAALHGAVWSGGSFVYVPAGTKLEFPAAELLPPEQRRARASLSTRSSSWRMTPTCTLSRAARRPSTTWQTCTPAPLSSLWARGRICATPQSRTGRRTCTTSTPNVLVLRRRARSSGSRARLAAMWATSTP